MGVFQHYDKKVNAEFRKKLLELADAKDAKAIIETMADETISTLRCVLSGDGAEADTVTILEIGIACGYQKGYADAVALASECRAVR